MKLYSVYKWLVYIPWLVFWTFISFVGVLFIAPFSQRKASRWMGRIWGHGLMYLVPAKLEVLAEVQLDRQQSCIVVSNHLSLMDIPILYGWLELDLKWVLKKELRRVPFIGGACAAMGHIFLDRSNSQASMRQLQQVKENLLPGTSILFFPEGTRSRDGVLKRFKVGAFTMAKDLDVPILPITIRGADTILPPDGMDLHPGSAVMIIHPPIDVAEVRASTAAELRDKARQIIASALEE